MLDQAIVVQARAFYELLELPWLGLAKTIDFTNELTTLALLILPLMRGRLIVIVVMGFALAVVHFCLFPDSVF